MKHLQHGQLDSLMVFMHMLRQIYVIMPSFKPTIPYILRPCVWSVPALQSAFWLS